MRRWGEISRLQKGTDLSCLIQSTLHSAQYFGESWIPPGMDTLFRNSDYKD